MKTRSVLRIISWGIISGLLVAALTSLALPLLFELYVFVVSLTRGSRWSGPIGLLAPDIWLGIGFDGARYLGLLNISGGVLLVSLGHMLSHSSLRSPVAFALSGGLIGILIATIGASRLTIVSGESNGWLFIILVFSWEVISFGWFGYQLYRSISLRRGLAN